MSKLSYNGVEWTPRRNLGHVTKAHIELAQRLTKNIYLGCELDDWAEFVIGLHKSGQLIPSGRPHFHWSVEAADGTVKTRGLQCSWDVVNDLIALEEKQWQTVVYFCIGASLSGHIHVKIGMTNDLDRRLDEWRTFSPGGLYAGQVRGAKLTDGHCHEFALRRGFKRADDGYASGTEWFLPPSLSRDLGHVARHVRALGKAYADLVGGVWDPSNPLLSKAAA